MSRIEKRELSKNGGGGGGDDGDFMATSWKANLLFGLVIEQYYSTAGFAGLSGLSDRASKATGFN